MTDPPRDTITITPTLPTTPPTPSNTEDNISTEKVTEAVKGWQYTNNTSSHLTIHVMMKVNLLYSHYTEEGDTPTYVYVSVGSVVGIVVYILTIVLIGLVISLKIKGTYVCTYYVLCVFACTYINARQ